MLRWYHANKYKRPLWSFVVVLVASAVGSDPRIGLILLCVLFGSFIAFLIIRRQNENTPPSITTRSKGSGDI
jgi:hypothetical protein